MNKKIFDSKKAFFSLLLLLFVFGAGGKPVYAQPSPSALFVPLIGITSVPEPLALPKAPGNVTYNYAVKNFLQELPLTNIQVTDDHCSPVNFVTGDDNGNSQLDYSETWRYSCSVKLATTTQSTATATGSFNNITATHNAYATVIVGSANPPPLVSIVNVTKVASPLTVPAEGGKVIFTYKVNNPGLSPLNNVIVSDDMCGNLPGKLGDTNGNNLLDVNEVWIYSCTAILKQTATNTATVTAFANGLKAVDSVSMNIQVSAPIVQPSTNLFDVAISPVAPTGTDLKINVWEILSGILMVLFIVFVFTRKPGSGKVRMS